jgi:hypothetical protein
MIAFEGDHDARGRNLHDRHRLELILSTTTTMWINSLSSHRRMPIRTGLGRITTFGAIALAHVGIVWFLQPDRSPLEKGPFPALEITLIEDRAREPVALLTQPLLRVVLAPPLDPPAIVFDAPEPEKQSSPIGQVIDRRAALRHRRCLELVGKPDLQECLRAHR